MATNLSIRNLTVSVEGATVLKNCSLEVSSGSILALMGQNGSGKSSLAYTVMGHPAYTVNQGTIAFQAKDITTVLPNARAQNGLFLAFQNPVQIPGVESHTFLKESYRARHGSVDNFNHDLEDAMSVLQMDYAFMFRNLNEGFSGGEKKRFELLQLLLLKPVVAILDEIDSGLDVDALKIIAAGLQHAQKQNPAMSIVLITHYQRILHHVKPDGVYVMHEGAIVDSGDHTLATKIEQQGYEQYDQ